MEGGLGSTRMGSRSSTRHGPASVFQGRVRRWHKSWTSVISSPSPAGAASRVLLYKWTPITLPTTNGGCSHFGFFLQHFVANPTDFSNLTL